MLCTALYCTLHPPPSTSTLHPPHSLRARSRQQARQQPAASSQQTGRTADGRRQTGWAVPRLPRMQHPDSQRSQAPRAPGPGGKTSRSVEYRVSSVECRVRVRALSVECLPPSTQCPHPGLPPHVDHPMLPCSHVSHAMHTPLFHRPLRCKPHPPSPSD